MNKEPSAEEDRFVERMPEPAPGRRVISFSLPQAEEPPVKKRGRKPKTQKAIDDYESEAAAAADAATAAAFAAFNAEDYKDLSSSPRRRSREAALLLLFAATSGSDAEGGWSFARNILRDAGLDCHAAVYAMELARQAYDRGRNATGTSRPTPGTGRRTVSRRWIWPSCAWPCPSCFPAAPPPRW